MRILITGGCGFIGSHLVRECLKVEEIERVVKSDALTYAGQPLNLIDIQDNPIIDSFMDQSIKENC